MPLSLRLIREIHGVLLSQSRGGNQSPGEFRRSQNWIGGTRPGNAAFVPPSAEEVLECMSKLEFFAEAVIVTATQVVETARQLLDLSNRDRDRISGLDRSAASALQVHRALMGHPIALHRDHESRHRTAGRVGQRITAPN